MPPKSYSHWEWRTDKGQTKPFTREESQALEKAYKEHRRAAFAAVAAAPTPAPAAETDADAEVEKKENAPAENPAEAAITAALKTPSAHSSVQVTVGGQTFTCDVAAMTQTNDRTKKSCKIRRLTGVGNNVKEEKPDNRRKHATNNGNNNSNKGKNGKNGGKGKGPQEFNHKFKSDKPITKQVFADDDEAEAPVVGTKRARSASAEATREEE